MAGVYTLNVEQGATKTFKVNYYQDEDQTTPVNLTGYTGRGQIRLKATDTAALASFTVEVTDAINGEVTITLPATALEGNANIKGKSYDATTTAYYDIELVNGTQVIRLLNGTCLISPEVTKA